MSRIPISTAKRIANDHKCRQVILVAWDGESTHVVTYGVTIEDCDQAALGGNLVKKSLGWPESLCREEPARVKKLMEKIKDLETEVRELKGRLSNGDAVARMVNQNLRDKVLDLEGRIANALL